MKGKFLVFSVLESGRFGDERFRREWLNSEGRFVDFGSRLSDDGLSVVIRRCCAFSTWVCWSFGLSCGRCRVDLRPSLVCHDTMTATRAEDFIANTVKNCRKY